MPANDDVTMGLARSAGWTDEQADQLCRSINMPLSGMKHSILSAELLVQMSQHHHYLVRQAVIEDDFRVAKDFDSKEGEKRRRAMLQHGNAAMASLREARQHYAQAAFFQTMLRSSALDEAETVETFVESDDQREERERAEALAERINTVAESARDAVHKGSLTKLENETKRGMERLEREKAEMAEELRELRAQMEGVGSAT